MDCQQAREVFVASLAGEPGDNNRAALREHCESCEECRAERDALRQTWMLLGQWPDAEPAADIGRHLLRRVRWMAIRESILTVKSWTPAVLAGVIGVALSLGLSLLVPYSVLVSLCRQALEGVDPYGAHYVVAGMVYGAPLGLGALVALRRAGPWGVFGSLEATVLFLLILAPYVIAQCREFPPALQVAFVSGMGVGALLGSGGGAWLGRRLPFAAHR